MTGIIVLIALAALVVWIIVATVHAVRTDGYAAVDTRESARELDRQSFV